MRAFDQRALGKPSDVTGTGSRVGSPSDFESTRIRRRDHANFAPKFHDRKATFPEIYYFGAPRAQKMRAFGQRALLKPNDIAATGCRAGIACRAKKACVRRRDHANVAANSRERIAKFPEF